jgi:AcrR family transcriptional regulator
VPDAMRLGEVEPDYLQWRTMPRRELSPILQGALDAFHENGYHGASIRDLARRVGITVPAIYYHHPSKESLLFALLDTSIGHLRRMCGAAAAEGGSPLESLDNLVLCLVRYTAQSGKVAYLHSEMRSLDPEHRRAYVEQRDAVEAMVREAVEAGVTSGDMHVDDPRGTTRAILGMVQSIATWYDPDGPVTVDELAAEHVLHARRLVGAEDQRTTSAGDRGERRRDARTH